MDEHGTRGVSNLRGERLTRGETRLTQQHLTTKRRTASIFAGELLRGMTTRACTHRLRAAQATAVP